MIVPMAAITASPGKTGNLGKGKAFNAKIIQTKTVKSLSAMASFETEKFCAPQNPLCCTGSRLANKSVPSTSRSTLSTFASHASCQYLLPRFCSVQATLHTSPKHAIKKGVSFFPNNCPYATKAAAMKPQKKRERCQNRSISNFLTSAATLSISDFCSIVVFETSRCWRKHDIRFSPSSGQIVWW